MDSVSSRWAGFSLDKKYFGRVPFHFYWPAPNLLMPVI